MHCLSSRGETIAFGIFNIKSLGSSIDILEVHPDFRLKGYGTELANYLILHLFGLGASYISVKCVPKISEQFWRKLGFFDMKATASKGEPLELWRPHQPT